MVTTPSMLLLWMGAHLVMRKIEMVTTPSMLLLWMGAHLVMRKIEMMTTPSMLLLWMGAQLTRYLEYGPRSLTFPEAAFGKML